MLGLMVGQVWNEVGGQSCGKFGNKTKYNLSIPFRIFLCKYNEVTSQKYIAGEYTNFFKASLD